MLKWFLHRQVARMESSYSYDAAYLHEVLDVSTGAFFKFLLFQAMSSHRDRAPSGAWFAAQIAATLSEDCGTCTQLVVNMALRARVPAPSLAAVIRGDIEHADSDTAFGFRYGSAVANNRAEAMTLAEEAATRYGRRGQVSLAFAVASARVYPCLKRGLGHAAPCTKVVVANDAIAVSPVA